MSQQQNCETKGCIHPQVMCDWNKADHCSFHFKGIELQSFTTTQFSIPGTSHHQKSYEHLLQSYFPTFCKCDIIQAQTKRQNYFQRLLFQSRFSFIIFSYIPAPTQYSGIMHYMIILLFYLPLLTSQQLQIPHLEKLFIQDSLIYTNIQFHLSCIMSLL